MWFTFFTVVTILVVVLCVIAAIRLFRGRDQPVNIVSSEEMDRDDAKS